MMEMGAELLRMLLRPELYHSVLAWFVQFSASAAAVLLTALWQSLAVALFLTLCLRFTPRLSAASRFVVLAGGFAAIVALPFLPVLMGRTAETAGDAGQVNAAMPAHPWLMMDARWSIAITLVWLAASLWRGVDLAMHTHRLRRLWKHALPVAAAVEMEMPKLRGRRAVEICTTEELERPSVIGFLAPRILIPSWLLERMTQAELEQIVLHETEHLRRGDDWSNLLQKLSLVIFPLNPALLWMERRLCLEREMACDEGVVRRTQAPRAYAACLTNLAEHGLERREQALSLGAWQRRPELVQRVHSLLARQTVLKPAAAGSMIAVLGCGIFVSSAELARCPQLFGFAEAPKTTQHVMAAHAEANAVEGDSVLRPEMHVPGMRAVNTAMSRLPAHVTRLRAAMPVLNQSPVPDRTLKPQANMASVQRRDEAGRAFAAQNAPKQVLLKAEAQEPSHNGLQDGQGQVQGWVVMTAMWEQSEVAANPVMSDSTPAGSPNTELALQAARPSRQAAQVVVTRLVFEVAPVKDSAVTNSQQNADSPPSPQESKKDSSAQPMPVAQPIPTIVPVRGGWLIFKL